MEMLIGRSQRVIDFRESGTIPAHDVDDREDSAFRSVNASPAIATRGRLALTFESTETRC